MTLRIAAFVFFYAALTLGAATIAHPSSRQGDLLDISQKATPLIELLPGASLWPHLFDLDARAMGYPIAILVMAALVLTMGALLGLARKQSKQAAKDREIEREERIRMRTRDGMR